MCPEPDPERSSAAAPQDDSRAALRTEIARHAARMVAEDGLDYANAKLAAAREIFGNERGRRVALPDDEELESEVRAYQAMFLEDSQPQRLTELRAIAIALLHWLAQFNPYLTGAVLNGTAGEHSDIHISLYCDSEKDVEIFLLNAGIDFDISEEHRKSARNVHGRAETISFLWRAKRSAAAEGVRLAIHDYQTLRMTRASDAQSGRLLRADLPTLLRIVENGDAAS